MVKIEKVGKSYDNNYKESRPDPDPTLSQGKGWYTSSVFLSVFQSESINVTFQTIVLQVYMYIPSAARVICSSHEIMLSYQVTPNPAKAPKTLKLYQTLSL